MTVQWKYGLISGVLCSLVYISILQSTIGKVLNPIVNVNVLLVYAMLLFILIMALLRKRNDMSGVMDFGEAMKTSLGVTVLTGFIVSLSFFVFFHWLNPGWYQEQSAFWKLQGKTIPARITAWQLSVFVLFIMNVPGAILSLVASLVMKRGA